MGDLKCDMAFAYFDSNTRLLCEISDIYGLQQLVTEPTCPGDKTRFHNTRVPEHKFNNRELHTQHISSTTQQDRIWSLIVG